MSLGLKDARRIDPAARARCDRACGDGDRDACVVMSIALELECREETEDACDALRALK